MKRKLLAFAAVLSMVAACQKNSSGGGESQPPAKPALPAQPSAMAIDTIAEIPLCEQSRANQVYYVRDKGELFACTETGGKYQNVKVVVKGPKGDTGDKGPRGDKGATGDKGEKGETIGNVSLQCLNDMQDVDIDPFKSLIAVEEAAFTGLVGEGQAWNLGTLLRQMLPPTASEAEVAAFVRSMFKTWAEVTQVPGSPFAAPIRDEGDVLKNFLCAAASNNGPSCTVANALVNPDKLPFRLLAIVNRFDINEARFTYGLNNGGENKFSLIIEYDLGKINKSATAWAADWHKLDDLPCTSGNCSAYQAQLKAITDQFAGRGVGNGVNGNALGQIRTNEAFFQDPPWEFREFILDGSGVNATLKQIRVAKNPPSDMNNTETLAALIVANAQAILNNTFFMPDGFKGTTSRTEDKNGSGGGPGFRWNFNSTATNVPENLRRAFAMNTCIGCHLERENKLDGFYHISPMNNHQGENKLSNFMIDNQLPTRRFGLMKLLTPSCQTSANASATASFRVH